MASIFKRRNKKSGKWLIAYTDENGARRVVTGAASKTVTEQIAAKLENEARLRRRGVIDARLDRYSEAERKPLVIRNDAGEAIGGHLADFHKALLAKGTTAKHAGMVLSRAASEVCKEVHGGWGLGTGEWGARSNALTVCPIPNHQFPITYPKSSLALATMASAVMPNFS